MFKFIICALLTLSLISSSCDNMSDEQAEDDPSETFTLVNKTGDDEAISVILFKSSKKREENDQTDCIPHILKDRECLTITGNQFNLIQILGDDEPLCGTRGASCDPSNSEVTESGMWWWHEFSLSELQEETSSEESEKEKKEKETSAKETEEEPKTCTSLECKTPAADDDEGDEGDNPDS